METPTGVRSQVEAPWWSGTLSISLPFYPVNFPHLFFSVAFAGFLVFKVFLLHSFLVFVCFSFPCSSFIVCVVLHLFCAGTRSLHSLCFLLPYNFWK